MNEYQSSININDSEYSKLLNIIKMIRNDTKKLYIIILRTICVVYKELIVFLYFILKAKRSLFLH